MTEQNIVEKPSKTSQDAVNLVAVAFLLISFGLLMIYSSSGISAFQKYNDSYFFFRKQCMIMFIGAVWAVIILKIPFRWIEISTIPSLVISLILLTLTLSHQMGHNVNGASRWLSIGPITFQPVELAKLTIVFFLSKNLSRDSFNINSFTKGILPNLLVLGLFSIMIMLQPDFGSTALILLVAMSLFYAAGLSKKLIFSAIFAATIAVAIAIYHAPYRLKRVMSFLDPWQYVSNSGFQIIQSYLGSQNGGLLGLGLGESKQKLYFLPEAHTDFILSVIGEELGLAGVLLVIFSFLYIAWLGLKITGKQISNYRKFLSFGLTLMIMYQAAINMGVCMGLLPTKGIPLPLVSYGASSLFIFITAIALLAKLDREAS